MHKTKPFIFNPYTIGVFLSLLIFAKSNIYAQDALLYNNGTLLFTSDNSILKVRGTVNNGDAGVVNNNGLINIDEDYENNSLSRGVGEYVLAGNWINNGIFIRETSTVRLIGDNQIIGGDSVTSFYNLILEGGGVKSQEIHSVTANILNLNDRELSTNQFNMHVTNNSVNAIQRTSGFVSSIGSGKLIRDMNAPTTYLFPTGSSLQTLRYRPVEIVHSNTQLASYGVRLANNDANLDGFDRTRIDSAICATNPLFFHLIDRFEGSSPADIRIYYSIAEDANWDGIANYDTDINLWNDLSPVAPTPATPLVFNQKNNFSDFGNQPFVLSRVRPNFPEIDGIFTICGGNTVQYVIENPQDGVTYSWSVNNGQLSNTTGQATEVNWFNQGDGTIAVVAIAPNGCTSSINNNSVDIGLSPNAAFTFNPTSGFGTDLFQFFDQSTGAVSWDWTFGSTGGANVQNPSHTFNFSDNHIVTLLITSEDGCTDTVSAIIPIIEGFFIPNVFSPNGDGVNDVFQISGSGYNNFKCQIFNRWGNLVFESSAPQISWNGRTLSGAQAPAGVYFVVLEIETPTDPISYNGTVTIVDPQ